MKRTVIILSLMLIALLLHPQTGTARDASPVAGTSMEGNDQPAPDPTGKTVEIIDSSDDSETEKPPPDPEKAEQLKAHFDPLQNNPQYFADPKFRKKLKRHQYMRLIKYKPNFGKKVWVKGWTLRDIEKKLDLFGREIRSSEYQLSALEVADEVAPFVQKNLAGSDIDYDYWSERFEEFGRTYVNPSKAGKKKTYFKVVDCQNGNYIIVQTTKPFRRKMAYFIAEDYDLIIKVLLKYGNIDKAGSPGRTYQHDGAPEDN